jgi:hypothetical protein
MRKYRSCTGRIRSPEGAHFGFESCQLRRQLVTLGFEGARLRFQLGKQRVYRQVARLYRLIRDLNLAHFGVE